MPILGCPGIDARVTLGNGPLRGGHVMDDTLYVVSGGTLYQVDEDNTTTTLGGVISGTGPVSMADNGTELVIVNGTNGYIWSSLAGFRLISDTDFNAADTVTFMDGFFLFNNSGTGKFFRSDLLDGTSYDSTAFATAESQSDDLLAVRNHKQVLYLLGQRSIELWSNVGAANFPFQRIPGATIDRGIAGSYAITDEDESLFILGDDRIAYRLNGRSLQRISTHAIEIEWQNYSTISDVIVFSYTWNGHKFICYTFPEIATTWEFDVATNLWHERKSHDRLGNDLGRWRANIAISAYSRVYIGDAFTGKLGTLSNTTFTEFGDDTRAIAVSPPLHDPNGKRLFMSWFELDMETGVGLPNTADALSASPGVDDEFTKALLHFNGNDTSTNFTDESGKIWTVAGNAQIDTAQSKFGGASGLFDGTGDFISTPDHADFEFNGDFTIDTWFNCNVATGVARAIAGQSDGAAAASVSPFILRRESAGEMRFRLSDGSAFTQIIGTTVFSDSLNTGWHHIAVTRSGNTLRMFIDGVQEGGDVAFSGTVPGTTEPFAVGARSSGGTDGWLDGIDEFRLSVGIARWAENFTPPTREYGTPLPPTQGSDPQAMMSISNNGGRTFDSPEVWTSIGKIGEYEDPAYRLRWDRLGEGFTFNIMIEISDPVRRAIYGARSPNLRVGM